MTTRNKFDDDEDAFDERGLLKDGKTVRARLMMMDSDSVQHAVAMEDARRARDEARHLYELDISSRWRGGVGSLQAGDVVSFGNRPGVVASHDGGRLVIADAMKLSTNDAGTIKQQAYDEYDHEISTAWMRTRDDDKPRAGAECSYSGYPGHYERDAHGNIVCVPDDTSDRQNVIAGPLSDEQKYAVRDEMYSAYEDDLVNAWRR